MVATPETMGDAIAGIVRITFGATAGVIGAALELPEPLDPPPPPQAANIQTAIADSP